MVRILYLVIAAVLAVFYYYFIGAGPGPSELPEDLEWWRPRGWLLRWDVLMGLAEMRDREGVAGLVPVFLFWIPPLALALVGFYLLRSAIMRVVVVWLSLLLGVFAYYGVSAERVWRFFEWRFTAVAASFLAIVAVCFFAPSLVRALARIPRVIAAGLLLALLAGLFLLQTEITGTDSNMRFNISPWPVLTVFGMLFFGYILASFHLAAGAGLWIANLRPGAGGILAGLAAAALIAGGASFLIFSEPAAGRVAFFAIVAGAYMLLARALTVESPTPARDSSRSRVAAGALIVALIYVGNMAATRNQVRARDVTAQQVLVALESYKAERQEYPESLEDLVPSYIDELPYPRIGLIRDEDDEFNYRNFGDSYALEFNSVRWVQCAYSPPYSFASYDEDEEEDEDYDDGDLQGWDAEVDVAARAKTDEERATTERLREAGLEGSWNCPKEPPKIW